MVFIFTMAKGYPSDWSLLSNIPCKDVDSLDFAVNEEGAAFVAFDGVPRNKMNSKETDMHLCRISGGKLEVINLSDNIDDNRLKLSSLYPRICLKNNDSPAVAWQSAPNIIAGEWDGKNWINFGNPMANTTSTYYQYILMPTIQMDPAGNPYLAWLFQDESDTIVVKHWDGKKWNMLPDLNPSKDPTSHAIMAPPALALDTNGKLYVAWGQRDIGDIVYFKYWDKNQWKEKGDSGHGDGILNQNKIYEEAGEIKTKNVSILCGPEIKIINETPYVAWVTIDYQLKAEDSSIPPATDPIFYICLSVFSNGHWSGLNGEKRQDAIICHESKKPIECFSFTIDNTGSPIICYREDGKLRIRKWNNKKFEDLELGILKELNGREVKFLKIASTRDRILHVCALVESDRKQEIKIYKI